MSWPSRAQSCSPSTDPPENTEDVLTSNFHWHPPTCPSQPSAGHTGDRAGPQSLLYLAPPSLPPSQPVLQATAGMLNPPLPACGGASGHKPGSGGAGGRSPPCRRLRKPQPKHLEKWVAGIGPASSSSWESGLLSQPLFPHPQVGIKHSSGNVWTPRVYTTATHHLGKKNKMNARATGMKPN